MSVATLTSPAHLVASVPFLLGFEPENSHVLIWLKEDKSIGLVQRTDLDEVREVAIFDAGVSFGFKSAICITFADDGPKDFAMLHDDTMEALEEFGVTVPTCIHYSQGKYWDYSDHYGSPGREIDEDTLLTVRSRFALEGMAVAPSRSTLIDEVTPSSGDARRYGAARRYVRERFSEIGAVAAREELLDAAIYSTTVESDIEPIHALRTVAALEDVNFRDMILWQLAQIEDTEYLRYLYGYIAEICRLTPAKHSAPILTVASVCAYLSGDGAKANVCLTLAADADPDYTMAQYLSAGLQMGLPPQMFREQIASMDYSDVVGEE